MTRKSKKLKKCLTFTILAGLLFSCQVEETFTNPDLVEKKGVIIHKKFDELIKETQFKTAFDKINQPKKGSSHKSGATSKTVMENRYGFTIADYPANIVSSHGITSYTFLITKDSIINNVFENLVVNLKENQEPKAFIYKFTSEISGHNITPNNSQGSINIVEIEYNPTQINNLIGGDCIILSNWECIYNPSTHGPDTAGCTGGYKETRVCTEGTSGGGGGSSGGYSGSVGGGTTTSPSNPIGGTGSTSQSVVIAPVKPTYTSVNLTTALSLDTNQQNWISSHGQIKKQLQQFLFADPFSTSNFTFALNAVNFYMQNTSSTINQEFISEIMLAIVLNPQPVYDINNFPGKTDNMPFEWWKDKSFIQQNLKMVTDSNINSAPPQPNEREVLLFSQFPLHALVHVKNSNIALNKSKSLVANGTFTRIHNGKADAFRHAFWNAYDTVQIGATITKLFTDAHEWNSGNNALESQMDFYNNQEGINLGNTLSLFSTESLVESTIITAIYDGSLQYLYPLQNHDGDNIIVGTTIKKFTNN